jgi:integrase
MRGNITRRGKSSWRLKFDDPISGERRTRYVTVKGTRRDAERELTRLLAEADRGSLIEASKLTLADYVRQWLENAYELSPKTTERYRQLAEQQIIPHLGAIPIQRLKPAQVEQWHSTILKQGGMNGRPLSARTVGHAHRVLHRALERAVKNETLSRNVASAVSPPKVEAREIEIVTGEQIASVLSKLEGHELYPIVALALATGMRRGELLALRWEDVDLDNATLKVERSLEESDRGLRFKAPKTKHGRRPIPLPPTAIEVLRVHRLRQLERRVAMGKGKPEPGALVFSTLEGDPLSPDDLSRDWWRLTLTHSLPRVSFHSLRHTHASALIASGLDVLTISRRLGHGSPVVTLGVYGHMFRDTGRAAADAIEAVFKK